VLRATERTLFYVRESLVSPPEPLNGWFELNRAVICESMSKLGSQCGTE
jgi:hypothetical protein